MNSYQKDLEEINHFLSEYQFTNSELVKELNALVQGADDVVLLLYSRRSLEVIITEMCEELLKRERGTEPLKGLIDRLFKDKFIPSYIHTSMSNLNSMSTYGAHPKEFNQRQVKSTIMELTTVLEWYINELKKPEKKSDKKQEEVKTETAAETKQEEIKVEQKPEKVKVDVKPAKSKEKSVTKGSEKKKKPVAIFVIIAIVLVAAVGYFIFSKKEAKPESQISEQTTDTTKESKTKVPTDKPAVTNKEDKTIKEIKTETTKPAEKPIVLPDDLDAAFNKIKEFSGEQQKKAANLLLERFTKDAYVNYSTSDSEPAKSYIKERVVYNTKHSYSYEIIEIKDIDGNLIDKSDKNVKIHRLKIREITN